METIKNRMQSMKNEIEDLHEKLDFKSIQLTEACIATEMMENELLEKKNKIRMLLEEMTKQQKNLDETTLKSGQQKKIIYHNSTSCSSLSVEHDDKCDQVDELVYHLKEANEAYHVADMNRNEAEKKLQSLMKQVRTINSNADIKERNQAQIENEMQICSQILQTLECRGNSKVSKAEKYSDMLQQQSEELFEVDGKLDMTDRTMQRISRDIENKKREKQAWKMKSVELKTELDNFLVNVIDF